MNYILIFILLLVVELVYFWLANRFRIIGTSRESEFR